MLDRWLGAEAPSPSAAGGTVADLTILAIEIDTQVADRSRAPGTRSRATDSDLSNNRSGPEPGQSGDKRGKY